MQKGELVRAEQPHGAAFKVMYSNFGTTFGLKVKFDGEFRVRQTGLGTSTVSYSLKLDYNSLIGFVGIVVGCGLVAMMSAPQAFIIVVAMIGVSIGYSVWSLNGQTAEKIKDNLAQQLASAHAGGYASAPSPGPAPMQSQPQSQPQSQAGPQPQAQPQPAPQQAVNDPGPVISQMPATPTVQVPQALSEQDELVVRLKNLATLRDVGAITQEDFDAKKAELLAKL